MASRNITPLNNTRFVWQLPLLYKEGREVCSGARWRRRLHHLASLLARQHTYVPHAAGGSRKKRFGATLAFVVTGTRTVWIYVAPITPRLWVLKIWQEKQAIQS